MASSDDAVPRQIPKAGEHMLVQCAGFRCLAYQDAGGQWRSVFGNQTVLDVLEVISRVDDSAARKVAGGIDNLLAQVDNLPPAPRILPRLLSELSDPETDVSRIVDLVAVDTVLTAKLLGTCNSAFFGNSQPVEDVSEAVNRLGFEAVYRTVAVVNGANCFKLRGTAEADADQLWRHSVTTAFAAQFIAEDIGLDRSLLFTAGILHDLGKVVLAGLKGKGNAGEPSGPVLNWEKLTFGFSHAEIGGRMLERWRFSDHLVASVKYHHDPAASGEAAKLAACVALADALAHRVGVVAERVACGPEVLAARKILGVAEEQMGRYDDRVRENLQFVEGMCRV